MINVTDLRIGNKIRQAHATLTVIGLSRNKVLCDDGNNHICWCTPENIDGLPLTEEWLIKFGYIKSNGFRYTSKGMFDLFANNDKVTYCIDDGAELKLKFVHQLQNLYFALCVEELNITL